jgi:hypothetical protein
MVCRPVAALALVLPLAACSGVPPNPEIGFATAAALPASATYDELLAAGARVMPPDALPSLIATMGEDAFARAIGGTAGDRLVIREDAAVCTEPDDDASCRRIVADGISYRVFALDGAPRGTLTPARG